jgi:uncharacterized damage-inducible protein DinB
MKISAIQLGTTEGRMAETSNQDLLEVVLDSWDRNNTILVNLLGALPKTALQVKATESGPSVAQMFTHIHFVRLIFISEDVPEFAAPLPAEEWAAERDPERLAQMLNQSAKAVRDAIQARVKTRQPMNLHYDHPVLMLQHMIWHEGYHHGQIKLALKLAGQPLADEQAGPITWDVWMNKK